MTDSQAAPAMTVFSWHPTYAGRSVEDVRRELADEIGRDQRSYRLALEGAEKSEHASLSAVMEVEKRWGVFSFDWADMEPGVLAERIVAFELAREQRRELFPFAEYRDMDVSSAMTGRTGGHAGARTDAQRRQISYIGAVVIMGILAIIVVIAVMAIL